MANLPEASLINQAQPEPKRPAAAALNFVLNSSSSYPKVLYDKDIEAAIVFSYLLKEEEVEGRIVAPFYIKVREEDGSLVDGCKIKDKSISFYGMKLEQSYFFLFFF